MSKKILIVEDEMVIATNLSMQLTKFGYEVVGILSRGTDAIQCISTTPPDIVLLDIQIKGDLDGIEVAKAVQKIQPVPIIYLTSNTDDATFERAKATAPYAFISKPYKKRDLKHAIELTIDRIEKEQQNTPKEETTTDSKEEDTSFILSDRIFVRHKDKMVKLFLKDIQYIEAVSNYSRIFTKEKEYLLSMTLKAIEKKLTAANFLRVHRSFIINVTQIDELSDGYIVIGKKAIPLSKSQKKELMKRVKML